MASTITVQNTMTWTQGYLYSQPLNLGSALEPAITISNIVKQAILGPPFCWRWNRIMPTAFALTSPTQDYSKAYADFGFLEKAWVSDGTNVKEVEQIAEILSQETVLGRPDQFIAAQLDDNAGNITFRVKPAPNAGPSYTMQVAYQKKAALITTLGGFWTPIPDELSYIYQYGFLGMALAFNKDPRAQIYDARFIAHLLGCQSGLNEMQKNIFLDKWLATGLQIGTANQRAQMGVQGRAQ